MNLINQDAIRHLIQEAVNEAIEPHLQKLSSAPAMKAVLTPDETMEILGCSKRTLQYLRDSKQIGFVQNGRKILFRAQDISEYLENNRISRRTR